MRLTDFQIFPAGIYLIKVDDANIIEPLKL